MQKYLFKNIQVVNDGSIKTLDVLIDNQKIEKVAPKIDVKENIIEI